MKINLLTLIVSFILISELLAQDSSKYSFDLFPSGKHIQTLYANYQEAKVGVLYFPSNRNLKVDIGNSVDLIGFKLDAERILFTLGIDFFAYALSTSFAGNRLQIDALDGFFGGNLSASKSYGDDKLFFRFRIIHNSAHLVDGHFNRETDLWIDNKKPIPYTKDMGELIAGYNKNYGVNITRIYGGLSYATLIRPLNLKRWNFSFGGETAFPNLVGTFLGKSTNIFSAFHFILNGSKSYVGNSNLMVGIKLGEWDKKGVLIFAEYYNGSRRFSEYYDQRVNEFGVGFNVDFF